MALLKCNLNIPIHVKLTEKGKEILDDYYGKCGYPKEPEYDEYYEFQMWEMIQIFGQHIYLGCAVPFESNEIVFVK